MAVISGDSMAGEAGYGTLRYLLTVPAGRAHILTTDSVPQFAAIHLYLPRHWWNSFDALLRVPIETGTLLHGLLSFGMYVLLSGSIAWARFTTADITC